MDSEIQHLKDNDGFLRNAGMLTQETVGEKTHNEAVSRNRDKEKALANTIS